MRFNNYSDNDPHTWFMAPMKSNEEVAEQFRNNTEWRGVQYLKMTSNEAFENPINRIRIPERVSCVYIDADHSYPACHRDILNAWDCLYDGGMICGHDYGLNTPGAVASKQDGVKQSVDEIFGEPDRLYEDTSWVVQKKEGRKII